MSRAGPAPEPVTDPVCHHAEGPVWDERGGVLRWVDMLAGDLCATVPGSGAVTRLHVGSVAAALRPRARGGLVVAVERGFALVSVDGDVETLPPVWDDPGIRMNDGACDPQGRFYSGSMAYDAQPGRAALYRLDPDQSVHVVRTGLTIANGLAWSPQGDRVYHIDTPTGRVDVFDHRADGTFAHRRTAVDLRDHDGAPDGMTVDAEGALWVALFDGAAVHRYLPDGRLDVVVQLPARKVTACTLGGPSLTTLYITTSREGLAAGEEPAAGAVYAVEVDTPGLPVAAFAG